MLETVTFPVAFCAVCARDVLVSLDLDTDEQWVRACTRCDAVVDADDPRTLGPSALPSLGYALEGDGGGCGSGGCGSCGASDPCAV